MNYEAAFPYLGIEIMKLPKIAVSIFNMPIYLYGLMIAAGVLAGTWYATHEAKRTGQDPDKYTDFLFYALILCVIGARLYYVIFSWDYYKDNLIKILDIRSGGLAIYGGVIVAVITAIIYTHKKNIKFGLFADTAVPGLILGQAVGRWGNFFNREVFGGYTDSFLAMQYLKQQVSFIPTELADKIITINNAEYIQVHPTFLYESLWNIFIFIIMNLYKRNKKFDGEIFGIYLLGYGIGRFWIEGMRTDQLLIWNTNLAVSQLLSMVLAVFAVFFITAKRKQAKIQSFRYTDEP